MVGYIAPYSGAVSTTVKSKIDELEMASGLVNPFGLMAAHNAFRKLDTASAGPYYVGITGYGDSMAGTAYTLGVVATSLQWRYGLGGLFSPNLGQSWSGATWTYTGGAAQDSLNFTYLPGANQINMPVGSTAAITTGQLAIGSSSQTAGTFPDEYNNQDGDSATLGFVKVRCFYLTRPGDGTLTFTLSQTNVTGYSPVPVSCNAALSLAYVDITVLSRARAVTLNVAASSAACVFVGAVFLRETGVLFWSSQVGGTTMEDQKPYITNGNYATIYKPLAQALSTALVIHAQRVPGDANWQANYTSVFTALDTIPAVSQLLLGEPPRNDGAQTPDIPVINSYLLSLAMSRGYSYFDQFKAVGNSTAPMVALGWFASDTIHMDPPAHRYFAGKILEAVNWFRVGGNRQDIDPLTMPGLLKRMPKLQALLALRSNTISGRAGATMDGTATSGGYTFAATNTGGFELNSAAALGYVAGRPGNIVTNSPYVLTTQTSVYVAFVGYRNLSLPAGVRAHALIGVNATINTLVGLAQRCFGFECAKGSDVGSPEGITGEVVRLLANNGTTTTYGPWVQANNPGAAGTSASGLNVIVGWNRDTKELELWRQSVDRVMLASILPCADLYSNNTALAGVCLGIVGENGGNVPASTGNFGFLEIKGSCDPVTYGITQNNLMSVLS